MFSGKRDVDYLSNVILGICSALGKGELNILVDHLDMKASDGEPVVYSPEVAERAVIVALCNSEFMVHNLNHVATQRGIIEKATHLFGQNKEMVGRAYELLDINGNELIKVKAHNEAALASRWRLSVYPGSRLTTPSVSSLIKSCRCLYNRIPSRIPNRYNFSFSKAERKFNTSSNSRNS